MTIRHHPSDELLLDYASGGLGETWSLAVATHLAVCPDCRRAASRLEAIGGSLLDAAAPEPLADGAFEALLGRIDAAPADRSDGIRPVSAAVSSPVLPEPLRDYVGSDVDGVPWRRLGVGAYHLLIPTGDGPTARLLRIPAGGSVPEHAHAGTELTLVLAGGFADATGDYGRGDFQEADEDLVHRPRAAPGEDCICLAVTDAPLRFKSVAARLMQPFLGI